MSPAIHWNAGERELCRALEPVLLEPADSKKPQAVIEREGRARLYRIPLESGEEVFVKQRFVRGGSARERIARAIGLRTVAGEWRALVRLYEAGVAVPEPIALGTLPGGDSVVVTRYLEGRLLKDVLPGSRRRRIPLLIAVGELIARLHTNGYVHRGLRWEDILVTEHGPVLLGLQTASRSRSPRARRRDIGGLEASLSACVSTCDRIRLRCAALGFKRPFGPPQRHALRAVGHAFEAEQRAQAASLTRRSLQPGPAFARIRSGEYRGMRLRSAAENEIVSALEAGRGVPDESVGQVLKRDRRAQVTEVRSGCGSWIVKDYRAGGFLRRTADWFRGSPARRAWLGGHGLHARNIGAATPIAFVERRTWGVPTASAIVLEDLQGLEAADHCNAGWADDREVVDALVGLAIRLHRRRVVHSDLKASHVLLERAGEGIEGRLIDLEGVRFRRRLGDRARIQALAEINASLPDRIPAELRCLAFLRYAAALPFHCDADDALRRIVAISLTRRHHWTGGDCEIARESRGRNRP